MISLSSRVALRGIQTTPPHHLLPLHACALDQYGMYLSPSHPVPLVVRVIVLRSVFVPR